MKIIIFLSILLIINTQFVFQRQDDEEKSGQKLIPDFNDVNNIDKLLKMDIPYSALLPKKQSKQGLGLLGAVFNPQILKMKALSKEEDNPLDQLNQILLGKLKNAKTKAKGNLNKEKLKWQNPDYKDGQNISPLFKIFGKKKNNKKRIQRLDQNQIKELLLKQMPSLKGGDILTMDSTHFNKAIMLNIQFQTVKHQIYMIKAKYRPKQKQIELISFVQKQIFWDEEIFQEQESAQDIQNIVSPTQDKPIVTQIPKKQVNKIQQQQKPELKYLKSNDPVSEAKTLQIQKQKVEDKPKVQVKEQPKAPIKEQQKPKAVDIPVVQVKENAKAPIKEQQKPKAADNTIGQTKEVVKAPLKEQEKPKTADIPVLQAKQVKAPIKESEKPLQLKTSTIKIAQEPKSINKLSEPQTPKSNLSQEPKKDETK